MVLAFFQMFIYLQLFRASYNIATPKEEAA